MLCYAVPRLRELVHVAARLTRDLLQQVGDAVVHVDRADEARKDVQDERCEPRARRTPVSRAGRATMRPCAML